MKGEEFLRTFGWLGFCFFLCKIIIFIRQFCFISNPNSNSWHVTVDCVAFLRSSPAMEALWRCCAKKLHKSVLSPRKRPPAGKCCIGCDVMRWFSKVSLGGWAGNKRHHYQTPGLVGMCAVPWNYLPTQTKKNIAVIPKLSPCLRRVARCGCVFHFRT